MCRYFVTFNMGRAEMCLFGVALALSVIMGVMVRYMNLVRLELELTGLMRGSGMFSIGNVPLTCFDGHIMEGLMMSGESCLVLKGSILIFSFSGTMAMGGGKPTDSFRNPCLADCTVGR